MSDPFREEPPWPPEFTNVKPLKLVKTDAMPTDWPQPIDLGALATRTPEQPKFIVTDWLPVGYATLIAGHGGVGKSGVALHLAVCIAAGVSFFGLPVERRRVLYLSCEDRESILHWRLSRICAHLELDLASLDDWLQILDLVGHDCVLWERDPRTGLTVTASQGKLIERMVQHRTELLVVDGITDTYAGNENARTEVKRYVNALVALIPPDIGAVLLVGHIAKPAASNAPTSEGYSGSTGWHNAVRARWYLYPETAQAEEGGRQERTGDLILELQKSNFGKMDQSMRFAWDDTQHLFIGQSASLAAFDRKHQDLEEQRAIRLAFKGCADASLQVPAAMTGPRTAYLVLSQRPEFPDSLLGSGRAKTARFRRQLETLRQMHHIEDSSYRRKDNRHAVATLLLTPAGCAECA